MKVRCITNECSYLTFDKEYEVLNIKDGHYKVINDEGDTEWFKSKFFRLTVEKENKDVDKTVKVKEFCLSDLRSGMIAIIDNRPFITIIDYYGISYFICTMGYQRMSDYNEDLTAKSSHEWDITKVYKFSPFGGINASLEVVPSRLLWERKNRIDMTLVEVLAIAEKQLGKSIQIVDNKEI